MHARSTRGTFGKTIIGAIGIALLAGCSDATTAPAARPAPTTARHSDVPPDTPCRSGWVQQDGFWMCPQP